MGTLIIEGRMFGPLIRALGSKVDGDPEPDITTPHRGISEQSPVSFRREHVEDAASRLTLVVGRVGF